MQFHWQGHVHVPVGVQRQVLVIQRVRNAVEVPQDQHMNRIVVVAIVLQNREPTSQTVQIIVEVPTVPAEVDDGWSRSLVSTCLIMARTACAEFSSAAEAALEPAA